MGCSPSSLPTRVSTTQAVCPLSPPVDSRGGLSVHTYNVYDRMIDQPGPQSALSTDRGLRLSDTRNPNSMKLFRDSHDFEESQKPKIPSSMSSNQLNENKEKDTKERIIGSTPRSPIISSRSKLEPESLNGLKLPPLRNRACSSNDMKLHQLLCIPNGAEKQKKSSISETASLQNEGTFGALLGKPTLRVLPSNAEDSSHHQRSPSSPVEAAGMKGSRLTSSNKSGQDARQEPGDMRGNSTVGNIYEAQRHVQRKKIDKLPQFRLEAEEKKDEKCFLMRVEGRQIFAEDCIPGFSSVFSKRRFDSCMLSASMDFRDEECRSVNCNTDNRPSSSQKMAQASSAVKTSEKTGHKSNYSLNNSKGANEVPISIDNSRRGSRDSDSLCSYGHKDSILQKNNVLEIARLPSKFSPFRLKNVTSRGTSEASFNLPSPNNQEGHVIRKSPSNSNCEYPLNSTPISNPLLITPERLKRLGSLNANILERLAKVPTPVDNPPPKDV